MQRYSMESSTIKYFKGYGFLSFPKKYKKKLQNTGLDASKDVVHTAGEFLGNQIADTVLSKTLSTRSKSNEDNIEKQKPVEKIIRGTKNCVLSAGGTYNASGNKHDKNIIFTIKDTKCYVPVVTSSSRDNQKLSKFFSK